MKLLGPGNDLLTETGKITKTGYCVMAVSAVFGFFCFLVGRSLYGKSLAKKKVRSVP